MLLPDNCAKKEEYAPENEAGLYGEWPRGLPYIRLYCSQWMRDAKSVTGSVRVAAPARSRILSAEISEYVGLCANLKTKNLRLFSYISKLSVNQGVGICSDDLTRKYKFQVTKNPRLKWGH